MMPGTNEEGLPDTDEDIPWRYKCSNLVLMGVEQEVWALTSRLKRQTSPQPPLHRVG